MFLFALVCLVDAASFALFLVACVVGLYQLILYKLQAATFYIPLKDSQLTNFK